MVSLTSPEHQADVLGVDGGGEVVVQGLLLLVPALAAEALHQEFPGRSLLSSGGPLQTLGNSLLMLTICTFSSSKSVLFKKRIMETLLQKTRLLTMVSKCSATRSGGWSGGLHEHLVKLAGERGTGMDHAVEALEPALPL